jgi:hypothetical protein
VALPLLGSAIYFYQVSPVQIFQFLFPFGLAPPVCFCIPVSFGTAKVETFSTPAKFILKFFFEDYPHHPFPLRSANPNPKNFQKTPRISFVAGCKGM